MRLSKNVPVLEDKAFFVSKLLGTSCPGFHFDTNTKKCNSLHILVTHVFTETSHPEMWSLLFLALEN